MLAGLLLAACTGRGPEEPPEDPAATEAEEPADADPDTVEEPEVDDATVATAALSTDNVQDLWLFEDLEVVSADGTSDISGELFVWLESAVDEVVELPGEATFHRVDALDARLLTPDEEPRDDVDIVAGYLDFEEARALAVLGTSHEGAPPIGYQDYLDLDVTDVDGVEAGDVLTYRLAFLQALPADDPSEETGLAGLELLVERLDAGRYVFAGAVDDDGEIQPAYFGGELAAVVEGSDRTLLPTKSGDMTEGMWDALLGCLPNALRCAGDWLSNLGEGGGAVSSWDQAKCNGNIGSTCPPPEPPPPGGICIDPPCGSTHGDPYLAAYNGRSVINFHLVGEFVLTSGDDLEVQVRMEPASPRGLSWNTGVAIGSDERRLTVVYEEGEVVSRVDGEPVPADGLQTALDDVGWDAFVLDNTRLQVTTDQGHTVTVLLRLGRNRYLDVYVDLAGDPRGFVGLLGPAHPDEPQGYVSRDGEELGRQIANRTERYEVFGDSWRLADEESLFDYADGESTATFTDLDYPPSDGVESDDLDRDDPEVAWAEAVCRTAGIDAEPVLGQCTLDLWATGDLSVVRSALTAERARQVREGEIGGEVFTPWSASEEEGPSVADGAIEADWSTTVRSLREEYGLGEGDRVEVVCPPEGEGRTDTRIWGTEIYWTTSPVCASAVHAGQATLEEGGAFELEILDDVDHPTIEVEPRNGIDPNRWSRRASGFRFLE